MIPLDLEEIFGSAVLDTVRRGLAFFGCLLLATLLSCFALATSEAATHLDPEQFEWIMEDWWIMAILPLASLWALLYVPLLIAAVYRFFTADSLLPRPVIDFLAADSFLMLAAVPDWDWARALALFLLAGCVAALYHLALFVAQVRRRRFEAQLLALAAENREARERLRREFGTVIPEPDDSK